MVLTASRLVSGCAASAVSVMLASHVGAALAADGCSAKDTKCLVVIGNSITRHGPSAPLDWQGDWGMAASSADKDFANQLLKQLQAKPGGRWALRKEPGFDLEANPGAYRVPPELARAARGAGVVVLQIGDNLDTRQVPLSSFVRGYAEAARALKPAQGALACVGMWWANADKDKAIKEACAQAGGVFVDLSEAAKMQANYARNERSIAHEGVGSHPGDAGMKAIAGKIHQAVAR